MILSPFIQLPTGASIFFHLSFFCDHSAVMRHSSLRHPVAVVRRIAGMPQPAFAKIVLIPQGTLAKIESCHLPLSEENARRISDNTGVSAAWLLSGDVDEAPPLETSSFHSPATNSGNFTRETFERHRAKTETSKVRGLFSLRAVNAELVAIAAAVRGSEAEGLFRYKMNNAVKALQREFGRSAQERLRQERIYEAQTLLDEELARSAPELEKAAAVESQTPLQALLQCVVKYARAVRQGE
jgi:hypothetical protein